MKRFLSYCSRNGNCALHFYDAKLTVDQEKKSFVFVNRLSDQHPRELTELTSVILFLDRQLRRGNCVFGEIVDSNWKRCKTGGESEKVRRRKDQC